MSSCNMLMTLTLKNYCVLFEVMDEVLFQMFLRFKGHKAQQKLYLKV